MKLSVFTLATAHQHGRAFIDYLALRKHHFVDGLGWDVPHDGQVEMDQYDTPLAHYSVVTQGDHVLGGARVMSTQHQWGEYTYMLGDAADGKLPGIPADIVPGGFEGPEVWECTRLVLEDDLPASIRNDCLDLIVEGVVSTARSHGATCMIALSQVAMIRAVRKLGYNPRQAGPAYKDPCSGRAHAVLTMAPWKEGSVAPDVAAQAARQAAAQAAA